MEQREELLKLLASTIALDIEKEHRRQGYDLHVHAHSREVSIKEGKKYTKIDVGGSGRYMVDSAGVIFGIKGYGVIHKGKQYGTLHSIADWYWGGYTAARITPTQ